MIAKVILYLKLSVATCFRNSVRSRLTLVGISLGLICFMLGNTALSCYVDSLYQTASLFPENVYMLSGYQEDMQWVEEKMRSEAPVQSLHYSVSETFASSSYLLQNRNVVNIVRLIGTSHAVQGSYVPVLSGKTNSFFPDSGTLLYGRDFTDSELRESSSVCLIEQSTAILLFQEENAVGKKLHLESDKGYLDLDVVGVLQDLNMTKDRNFQFNKSLDYHQDTSTEQPMIRPESGVYVPNAMFDSSRRLFESGTETVTFEIVGKEYGRKMNSVVQTLDSEIVRLKKAVAVHSKSKLQNEVAETQSDFNIIKILFSVFLFVISGFVILTVLLFAIKERVYEIGIRRSVGASAFSILVQFVTEGMVLSLLAALISTAASIIISNFITVFLRDLHYIDFVMKITPLTIMATFGVSLLEGVLFSFIPAVAASHIKPTDAIRWD